MIILKQINNIILVFLIIFIINLSIEYKKYEELISEEIYQTKVEVLNIYDKKDYLVLKLNAEKFYFFTSIQKDIKVEKFDILDIGFISKNISFIEYLKGFYAKSIYFDKVERKKNFKDKIIEKINLNHDNQMIKELFQALFLAIPDRKSVV